MAEGWQFSAKLKATDLPAQQYDVLMIQHLLCRKEKYYLQKGRRGIFGERLHWCQSG